MATTTNDQNAQQKEDYFWLSNNADFKVFELLHNRTMFLVRLMLVANAVVNAVVLRDVIRYLQIGNSPIQRD